MRHSRLRGTLWLLSTTFFVVSLFLFWQYRPGNKRDDLFDNLNKLSAIEPEKSLEPVQTRRRFTERDFVYVWEKRLRRPLVDPPPPPPPSKPAASSVAEEFKKAPKPPQITLAATWIEDDAKQSRAWVILPGGNRKMVMAGEALSEVSGIPVVTDIADRRIVMEWGGDQLIAEIPQNAQNLFELQ